MNCAICGKYSSKQKNPVMMTIPGEPPLDICAYCLPPEPKNNDRYEEFGGYVYIRDQNGRWIPEHRKVWEDYNGLIPEGWIIHHINGNKWDNRIENLEAMPRYDHKTRRIDSSLIPTL